MTELFLTPNWRRWQIMLFNYGTEGEFRTELKWSLAYPLGAVLVAFFAGAAVRPLIDKSLARFAPPPILAEPLDRADHPDVLVLGDSISIGYTEALRELLPQFDVFRAPENTENSLRLLRKLPDYLGGKKWSVIHYNAGLHDLKRVSDPNPMVAQEPTDNGKQLLTLQQYEENMTHVADILTKTGAKVIFATTTPVPPGSVGREAGAEIQFNRSATRIALDHGFCVDDLHQFALTIPGGQLLANVHFTGAGYGALAGQVARSISQCMSEPTQ